MSVFIELTTEVADAVFNKFVDQMSEDSDERRVRAGAPKARRPVRGLEVKDDTYALLKVTSANGEDVPIFNSSTKRGQGRGTTNFILQSVQESRVEKHQILETFGDSYLFFFGQHPIMLNVSAVLLNSQDFNWQAEFLENYNLYFRGTKLVELGARCYLFYDDNIIEGYMLNTTVVTDANNPMMAQMSFQFFVSNYKNISFVGNPNFPVRQGVPIPPPDVTLQAPLGKATLKSLVDKWVGGTNNQVSRERALRGLIADNKDEIVGGSGVFGGADEDITIQQSLRALADLTSASAGLLQKCGVNPATAQSPGLMKSLGTGPNFVGGGVGIGAGAGVGIGGGATFGAVAGVGAGAGFGGNAGAGAQSGFSSFSGAYAGVGASATAGTFVGQNFGPTPGFGAQYGYGSGGFPGQLQTPIGGMPAGAGYGMNAYANTYAGVQAAALTKSQTSVYTSKSKIAGVYVGVSAASGAYSGSYSQKSAGQAALAGGYMGGGYSAGFGLGGPGAAGFGSQGAVTPFGTPIGGVGGAGFGAGAGVGFGAGAGFAAGAASGAAVSVGGAVSAFSMVSAPGTINPACTGALGGSKVGPISGGIGWGQPVTGPYYYPNGAPQYPGQLPAQTFPGQKFAGQVPGQQVPPPNSWKWAPAWAWQHPPLSGAKRTALHRQP